MAERRMFAKTIVISDAFLDLPASSRALYFALGVVADDEGFINNPKTTARMTGASTADLDALISAKFLIAFDDGVVVIKHWLINNAVRSDRFTPTKYKEHREKLSLDENNAYTLTAKAQPTDNHLPTACQPTDDKRETQVSIGIDKDTNCYIITMTLNDGGEYGITQGNVDEWAKLYPALNVEQELRSMRAWLDANPANRKTRTGIKRFIVNWLNRSQNSKPAERTEKPVNKRNDGLLSSIPDDMFEQAKERSEREMKAMLSKLKEKYK